MRDIFTQLIDLIFPPSPTELELRRLVVETIFDKLPPAPRAPLSFITAIFAYKNPLVSDLIWHIKYKKDRHCIEIGGYALYKKLREIAEKNELGKIILIPVPISKQRRKERGYNQCELLIDAMKKLDSDNIFEKRYDILLRTKHTERQTLKNRKDRIEGAEHVFSVTENILDLDLQIVIIDDVATTGSTLKEARDVLLKSGFRNVTALTLAH